MSQPLSNANEVSNLTVAFGTQAFDDDEVLRAFERTVFAAMLKNTTRNRLPDVRQSHQFCGGSGVKVDAVLCPDGQNQKAKGYTQKQKAKGKRQRAKVGRGGLRRFI